MKNNKKIKIALVAFYMVGISLTYGYMKQDVGCYTDNVVGTGFMCDLGNAAVSLAWPSYWLFHSGSLLFEPDE